MALPRLTSRAPAPGVYTSPGAFNGWITLVNPANPTAGVPATPYSSTWAAIRAIGGQEMDKVQQFAQQSTHLVVIPFQKALESMTIAFNDGDETRLFQIEYIEDPDELGRELHLFCFEMNQNAGSGAVYTPPTPAFFKGTGAPTLPLFDSAIYWDSASGNLYEQIYGTWVLAGNISGGATELPSQIYRRVAAASTNLGVIKVGAGIVTGWKIYNNAQYPVFVKLFDKATNPALGTDTPAQLIGINAGETEVEPPGPGTQYNNGIAIAVTKQIDDLDTTAVAAKDCGFDIFYQ